MSTEEPVKKRGFLNCEKGSALDITLRVIGGIIGFWSGSVIYQYVHHHLQMGEVQQQLIQSSSDLNKKLPMMVDAITRLDNTSVGPQLFYYRYTLVGAPSDLLDPVKLNERLRPLIVQSYRTNDGLKTFRENGVSVDYGYFDPKGNHITDIEVGPNDLK